MQQIELFSRPPAASIAGVDEAGRGALVGNVVAAAVILPPQFDLPRLTDSKKLTANQREQLFIAIQEQAIAWSVACASPVEIDNLNIHHATLLAMQRAVAGLIVLPQMVLVDGKFTPNLTLPSQAIIGGDQKEPAISAASILAKVSRDYEMLALDKRFPQYGFAQHKGYGTKKHLAALKSWGITPEHRKNYAPVQKVLEKLGESHFKSD